MWQSLSRFSVSKGWEGVWQCSRHARRCRSNFFLLNVNETWNNVYVLPSKTTVVSGGGDLCRGQEGVGGPVPLGCVATLAGPPPLPLSYSLEQHPHPPEAHNLAAPLKIMYFSSVIVESHCASAENKCLHPCTVLTGTLLNHGKIMREKKNTNRSSKDF